MAESAPQIPDQSIGLDSLNGFERQTCIEGSALLASRKAGFLGDPSGLKAAGVVPRHQ